MAHGEETRLFYFTMYKSRDVPLPRFTLSHAGSGKGTDPFSNSEGPPIYIGISPFLYDGRHLLSPALKAYWDLW